MAFVTGLGFILWVERRRTKKYRESLTRGMRKTPQRQRTLRHVQAKKLYRRRTLKRKREEWDVVPGSSTGGRKKNSESMSALWRLGACNFKE